MPQLFVACAPWCGLLIATAVGNSCKDYWYGMVLCSRNSDLLSYSTGTYCIISVFLFSVPVYCTVTCTQWWDSAGLHRFCRTVSGNFIKTANRLALLLVLVPLVETELADNI